MLNRKFACLMFLFCVSPFSSALASFDAATEQELIQISAEKYPGKVFHMGAHLSAPDQIDSFYYDDQDLVRHSATFDQLKKGFVVITMDSYKVVLLSMTYNASTKTGKLKVSYLHNGLTNSYEDLMMTLDYDQHRNMFEIKNEDNEVITSAYAWTRTILGQEIGIDHIDFNK